jgi:hypothetical protein
MNRRISPSFQVSFLFLEYHWTMEVPSAPDTLTSNSQNPTYAKCRTAKSHKCLFATCKHPQLPVRIALPEEPHCFLQRHHNMHSIDCEGVRKNVNSVWVCFSLFVFDLFMPVCWLHLFLFNDRFLNSCTVARIICVTLGGVVYEHSSDHNCKNKSQRVTLSKSKGNNAIIPCNPVWKIKQQRFNFNKVNA